MNDDGGWMIGPPHLVTRGADGDETIIRCAILVSKR